MKDFKKLCENSLERGAYREAAQFAEKAIESNLHDSGLHRLAATCWNEVDSAIAEEEVHFHRSAAALLDKYAETLRTHIQKRNKRPPEQLDEKNSSQSNRSGEQNNITFKKQHIVSLGPSVRSDNLPDKNSQDEDIKIEEFSIVDILDEQSFEEKFLSDYQWEEIGEEEVLRKKQKLQELWNEALECEKKGNYQIIGNKIVSMLQIAPNHQGINDLLLWLQKKTYKTDDYYLQILKEDPNNVEANYSLAIRFNTSQQYAKAIEHFCTVLKVNPSHLSAHAFLGSIYSNLGDSHRAKTHFIKSLARGPNGASLFNFGCLLMREPHLESLPYTASSCLLADLSSSIKVHEKFPEYDKSRLLLATLPTLELISPPLLVHRILENSGVTLDQLRAIHPINRIFREHLPVARWFLRAIEKVSEDNQIEQISLLWIGGDPIQAFDHAFKYWKSKPDSPKIALMASSLAIELLEMEKANEIIQSSLPYCLESHQRNIGSADEIFYASLFLRNHGHVEDALLYATACQETTYALPALWVKWDLLSKVSPVNGDANSNDLMQKIVEGEKDRIKANNIPLFLPLGLNDLVEKFDTNNEIVEYMLLQQLMMPLILRFLDTYSKEADIMECDLKEWKLKQEHLPSLPYYSADQIRSFKTDVTVNKILNRTSGKHGKKLLSWLAEDIRDEDVSLASRRDMWKKVIVCHIENGRLNREDNLIPEFFGYLYCKHLWDRCRRSKGMSIQQIIKNAPPLAALLWGDALEALAFLKIGEIAANLLEKLVEAHAPTFTSFEDFCRELPEKLTKPEFQAKIRRGQGEF